ncbi:DMT family transporter [Ancylobacter sp. A5.8]|uniref:DMT family transporter n=1 Tax=Ancylobacter gelatini TaxID=2919920 RepID=UPI001F4E94DA|nr:DMT family transporter [Ancylobacter gelatini]MCJ8144154.1 DMT family transporter [Ancylobacter gelatini]
MLIGILAGLTTGALWGLAFVSPRAVAPFSAWDLTLARYVLFGLTSAVLMILPRFRPVMSRRQLVLGFLLGGFGNVGYFLSAAYAVQFAGAVLPLLIIGTSPVVLSLIANLREKAVSWRALLLPFALVLGGILTAHAGMPQPAQSSLDDRTWLGILAALSAVGIWVVYGLGNSQILRAPDAPDVLGWTGLQGLGAAAGALMLVPLLGLPNPEVASDADMQRFTAWVLVTSFLGCWFATLCWMVASNRLPMVLTALLIVAETGFGLLYGLIFEQRLPTTPEAVGIAMQLSGVILAILSFTRRPAAIETIAIGEIAPR